MLKMIWCLTTILMGTKRKKELEREYNARQESSETSTGKTNLFCQITHMICIFCPTWRYEFIVHVVTIMYH